ncbi:MAG: hypothetical protein K2X48_04695 [Chitinophagaceae bacterium]|nr:hypothetical protein [Chitinophagaceae bacterium]
MYKDFPSLHPLIVHFPIVLILMAAVLQILVVWKPDWKQIRWAAFFIMGGAFLFALLASTVFHAEPSADAPKSALEIFEQHEKYAQLTLWMSGITLLVKGIGIFFIINKRSYGALVLIAAIVTAVFLSIAGHHGARLTHVAGVGPMGRYLMKGHGGDNNENEMKGMDMSDSAMKMNNTMPGMNNVPGMDTMRSMKDMPGNKDMKNMPGMNMKNKNDMDMTNMKDMNMKSKKGMDMKNMDMRNMKDTNMKNKNMTNMPGMDTMGSMKNMDMANMPGIDSMKNMKGMDMKNMKYVPGLSMKTNPMDTIRFPDNNPGRKNKKPIKQ